MTDVKNLACDDLLLLLTESNTKSRSFPVMATELAHLRLSSLSATSFPVECMFSTMGLIAIYQKQMLKFICRKIAQEIKSGGDGNIFSQTKFSNDLLLGKISILTPKISHDLFSFFFFLFLVIDRLLPAS